MNIKTKNVILTFLYKHLFIMIEDKHFVASKNLIVFKLILEYVFSLFYF